MSFFGVDIPHIILALIAVANYILAISIYLSSDKRSSRFFFFTILSVVVWASGVNIYIRDGVNEITYLVSSINYIAAALISVFFFYFAFLFNQDEKVIPRYMRVFTGASLAVLIFLIVSPGFEERLIVKGIQELEGDKVQIFGWLYPLYAMFVSLYFFAGLLNLLNKFRKATGEIKTQLIYIIFGTGLSIFSGITTNIIFPNLGITGFDYLGPSGTFMMIGFVFMAIRKHGLWNFKLIAISLLIGLMSMLLIIQVVISESPISKVLQSMIFVVVLVFGYFLLKGLLKGIENKEKLQQLAINLKKANKKLKEIDSEKSDFVSITSHQFRTPLTVIKGYTSMLLEGSFGSIRNKDQYKVLEKVFRASQRLVLLIEDFLNVSRLEKGEMHYTFKQIDLRKLISDIINQFKITIKEERIRFTLNADLGEQYNIRADELKLQQVIKNIIDNAIKYTHQGGEVTVSISRLKREGIIRVTTSDDGIGIPADMMGRLFEKFSRGRGISKLHTEGRGLGLYVSKQIIAAHGGRIWAESKGKNLGTSFNLDFKDPAHERKRKEIKTFIEDL